MYSLTCTPSVTSGETVSRIAWFKNDQELRHTTTETFLTYTITSLTAGDNGDYTCRVDVGSFSKILTKSLEISTGKLYIFNKRILLTKTILIQLQYLYNITSEQHLNNDQKSA